MSDHYRSPVVTAAPNDPLSSLGALMRERSVGSVVITDEAERPLGIVTDRDLCCRGVARDASREAAAKDVMSQPVFTAEVHEPLQVLIERMAEHGVRRMPILQDGVVVGMVSLDDLVVSLSDHLRALGEATYDEISIARARARRSRESRSVEEPTRARLGSTLRRFAKVLHRPGGAPPNAETRK